MTHKHKYSIPSADDQNDARCIECGQLQPTTQPAKHTPGPWQISAIQNEPEKISIIDADMCFVAEVWQTYINGESRQQAHATLIAAAPAMYEALGELVAYLRNHVADEVLDNWAPVLKAAYALAQAEGKQ